ncbi:MAG TPA: hypothetical protein VF668_04995, partial [Pyrinomonadaceae bacterium]
ARRTAGGAASAPRTKVCDPRTRGGDPPPAPAAPAPSSPLAGFSFPRAQVMTFNRGFVNGAAPAFERRLAHAGGRLHGDGILKGDSAVCSQNVLINGEGAGYMR